MQINKIDLPESASRNLATALSRFRDIVGEENVLTGDAANQVRDPYWPGNSAQFETLAFVRPGSVEEIQAIVKVANETGVPIWTISTGSNKGYGGGSPRVMGSVVLSLHRLNQILEINEELGYAVVQPGVTFIDLSKALEDRGIPFIPSTPDLGTGSVLGNTLEHGICYGPLAANHQIHCGVEVVLADGTLLRSGTGAMPGSDTFHLFKRGYGPPVDQIFLQSNFGIVVTMGIWLTPKPKKYHSFNACVMQESDLGALVEVVRQLLLDRVLEGVPRIYNTATIATLAGDKQLFWQEEGLVPEPVLQGMSQVIDMGRYMCHGALWECDDILAKRKLEIIQAAFEVIPGLVFKSQSCNYDDVANLEAAPDRIMAGFPEAETLDVVHWPGRDKKGGHTTNGLIVPMTAEKALQADNLCRTIMHEAGFDYFSVLMAISARSYIHLAIAIFNVDNTEECDRAYGASRRLIEDAAKLGFSEYRAHVYNMDVVSDLLSFSDKALPKFLNTLKDAVDPNGILAPGKQGIWPKIYR